MTSRALLVRSRPRFWLYLAGPVLVGAVYAAESVGGLFTPTVLVLFGYFLVPANLFLYGINDVFDADADRKNPKKADRESRYRGDAATRWSVTLSFALGFALLAITPTVAAPWLLGFLVLGAAYSAPPLRLKTRPPLDSLSNGLYILPGATAYAAVAGTTPPALALLGGWLWAMAMHTFSAIPDIEPDRRAGIETTATRLGGHLATVYCGSVWALAAGVFALLDHRLGLLMLAYPILLAGITLGEVDLERAYWWYPAVNASIGMVFTLGGLWALLCG
ncbi:prenyltransferase [Natronorubrum daqingense]|uniref:4-hydroxybenzoate polyprenyltransferase n=1 Tax=Natronorubrum daqingense TaxID=588898 RepID=A0A1N7E6K8_9EURY|nr:prenyltransferase [Natronorubrum daqingense]APX96389.1 lycopene elongase [Natronorubrum daqingense]SIR83674.1 4-hydroxybenzoate polyprenyltransferase [Natronorubrum daqingense]